MSINNDNFADRRDLGSGTTANDSGSNLGFTLEEGEPLQSGTINSAWWSWTPTETGLAIIDTHGSDFYTSLSVFTGDAVDSLTLITKNFSSVGFWAEAGTQYQIAVDGIWDERVNIQLNLEQDLSIFNDNFADRRDLGNGTIVSDAGNNLYFTSEEGEPSQSGEIHSAWWSWNPAQSGWVVIDTEGSDFYAYLSVFTGNTVDSLTLVAQSEYNDFHSSGYVGFWAEAGTQYQIAVDGDYHEKGNIKLNLEQDFNFILNDDFADRRDLGDGTIVSDKVINVDYTSENGEPSQWGEINSAWWSWTPAQTGWVVIDTAGSNFRAGLSVFTGNAVDSLTLVAQNSDRYFSWQSPVGFWAEAGTEYQIAVDGYDDYTGKIQLNLEQDLNFILNDNFADRRDLGDGTIVSDTGSNFGYTSESGEPSQSGEIHSAWWSWTPAETGWVLIDTGGSDFYTYLSVFTGNTVDSLTLINQGDYYYSISKSRVVFWAEAGTQYQIAVDGNYDYKGKIQLDLEQDLNFILNDNFADRRDLGDGTIVSDTGSNFGYTSESGEPSQSGEIHSAWWSWTPAETGWVLIDTGGSDFYTYLSVFTGNAVDSLTLVNQDDDLIGFWAEAGTEYQIAVDGISDERGNIQLNLEQDLSFIPNDNFADRRDLGSSTMANDSSSSMGFTSEEGEPSQWGKINSAWWSWTPTETGLAIIDTHGSDFYTYLSVFTGDAVNSLTLITKNFSPVGFWAEAGTEYQIAVNGSYGNTGKFQLNLEQDLSFIPNDNFADRIDLGSGTIASAIGSNFGFTSESGEPSQSIWGEINSAWWSWTPAETGWVVIDTESSDFDTYLSVFTGNAVDSLTLVAQIGDSTSGSQISRVGFWAETGTEYQIAVDGSSSQTGNIQLNLEQDLSFIPNDNFADRRDLGSSTMANDSGSNLGFTSEEGEPSQLGEINSAWWSWTPAQTGWVIIDTENSDLWSYLSVFTGNAVDSLTLVNQDDDPIGFWAEAGTEYQIAVDGDYDDTGDILLNLEQDLSFIANDNFADRRDLGSSTMANDSSSSMGFTSEEGEPSQWGGINSAWWSWTPAQSGWVVINTYESDFETDLSVFTGNAVDSLTRVARAKILYDIDHDIEFPEGSVGFWAEAGTEYQIAVDGTGNIELNLEQDLNFLANDNFADRIDLGSGTIANDTGSNVGFTSESGEPSQSGEINSAWWSWTPAQTGWVVIDSTVGFANNYLSIFTGNAVDSLTLITQSNDHLILSAGDQSVGFWAEAGTEYQIAVDGFWSSGNIEFNLEQDLNFVVNDNFNVYQVNLMGTDETDLLLQNKISGKFQIWELEGNKIVGNHYVANASTNKQPQINDNWDVLTGNFTGTHQDDILLKNKVVGTFSLWEMEDNFIIGTHTITRNGKVVQLKNNQNWDLIVGNFAGSEHDDILLRNKISGNLQVWEIHDKEIIASHKIMNPLSNRQISLNQNWQIFSTKFGSGVRDNILLRNKISGGLQVWDMDGNQLVDITHLSDPNYNDYSLVI